MSVTLISMKNGTPKPIRLSIWDAFKGAPPRKPRPHKCNCCNAVHRPGVRPEPKGNAKIATTGRSTEGAVTPEEVKQASQSKFTEIEDAKLKELKSDKNFQWAKAAEEMGLPVDELKRRWKELKSIEDESKSGEKKEQQQDGSKQDDGSTKMTRKEKKEMKRKQEEQKKEEEAISNRASPEVKIEPALNAEQAKPTQNKSDEKRKWEKAAAKHFDRTGKRITPEQAHKIAEAAT